VFTTSEQFDLTSTPFFIISYVNIYAYFSEFIMASLENQIPIVKIVSYPWFSIIFS
jgi:hypothetical protein